MDMNKPKWDVIIFVYNADAGLFSLVSDFAHKIISPQTYACHLCQLTYGNFSIKKDWKNFVEKIPFRKEFLHRDEFIRKYPNQDGKELPAVYGLNEGDLTEILSANEINAFEELEGLKNALREKMAR